MARHEFEVDLREIYSDTDLSTGRAARSVLIFRFAGPVDGLDRLVVFCVAGAAASTRREAANRRLVAVYPFEAYATFARFQTTQVPGEGYVYGAWEADASGAVTKFALQVWRAGTLERLSRGPRPLETDEPDFCP